MNKWNNRLVLLFFALILTGVYWLYRESKSREPMLVAELLGVNLDSAQVDKLIIYPETEQRAEFVIQKMDSTWYVKKNNKRYFADQKAISEVLDILIKLQIGKITSTDQEVWRRYAIDEESASSVKLFSNGEELYTVHFGKFDMTEQSSAGRTYFRVEDRIEIFETAGFLSMNINRGFDTWRDKTVIESNTRLWTNLIFEYSADSSFSINRNEKGRWTIENVECDSSKISDYLGSISGLSESKFIDDLPNQKDAALYKLMIKIRNEEDILLSAIPLKSKEFVLLSTKKPESWFRSHKYGLIRKIFKGRSYFETK